MLEYSFMILVLLTFVMKIIFVFLFFRQTVLVSQLTTEGRPAFLRAMEETDHRIEPESFNQMECPIESSSVAASKSEYDSALLSEEQLQSTNQGYVHKLSWNVRI